MIFLHLARQRDGQNGAAELQTNAARLKPSDWPYPVIELLLGKRTPDELLAAAANDDQRCEAQFYGGEWLLINGDRDGAAAALQTAANSCPKDTLEYEGAVAELKRMTAQTGDARSAN